MSQERVTPYPPSPTFVAWPKIYRLYRPVIITEKVDGSNAAIHVPEDDSQPLYAQSRKRIITPQKGDDNFGFAAFVQENSDEIRVKLGPGLHFGEWYGLGIQRGYGLDEKRFALFNVKRWKDEPLPEQVCTVPVLYEGAFSDDVVRQCLTELRTGGSLAGIDVFDPAEGVVVYFTQANTSFKVTLENDEMSKGEADAAAARLEELPIR